LPQALELADEAPDQTLRVVAAIEVIGTEFVVGTPCLRT
jgi:hypothetical protein